MDFLLSSRCRVIAQLNRESNREFGLNSFSFSEPRTLDDDGKTSVVVTPITNEVNEGESITLRYDRRVINHSARVEDLSEGTIASFVHGLEIANRVEFEPGCFKVVTVDGVPWLTIDDYVVVAKIKLECKPDETI